MKKTKEQKEQEKIEKKLAKATKKLDKKMTAYTEAVESGDSKKAAKAAKKLAKAQAKFEKDINKIEEKYGITLHQPEEREEAIRQPQSPVQRQARAGVSSAYDFPEERATDSSPYPQAEQETPQPQSQPQSTGDPFIDLLMSYFQLVMDMQRQRFEAHMALVKGTQDLIFGRGYQPLYPENQNQTFQSPENTLSVATPAPTDTKETPKQTKTPPSMTPEQIAFMLQQRNRA